MIAGLPTTTNAAEPPSRRLRQSASGGLILRTSGATLAGTVAAFLIGGAKSLAGRGGGLGFLFCLDADHRVNLLSDTGDCRTVSRHRRRNQRASRQHCNRGNNG